MTDKSDRQDGDGLRAKLIEFDSFLNEPPAYEDKTMVRDYRHSAYAKWSSLCADIVRTIDTRAPTRDGAEGACIGELKILIDEYDPQNSDWNFRKEAIRDVLFKLQTLCCLAAPPKPAPDAVRASRHTEQNPNSRTWTAGIDVLRQYDYQDRQWHLSAIEVHHKDEQEAVRLRNTILAALAAPVPSPDVVRCLNWAGECVHFKTTGKSCETCASPSPAVAAEPVVRDTNMFSRLAHEPLAVIPEGCSAPLEIRTAAEIEFDRKAAKEADNLCEFKIVSGKCAKCGALIHQECLGDRQAPHSSSEGGR